MTVWFRFQPGTLLRRNSYIKHHLSISGKERSMVLPSIATSLPSHSRQLMKELLPHHIGYSLRWLTVTHNFSLRTFLRTTLALLIDLRSHETHWFDHSLIPGYGSVSICCIPGAGNTGLWKVPENWLIARLYVLTHSVLTNPAWRWPAMTNQFADVQRGYGTWLNSHSKQAAAPGLYFMMA